MKKINRKISILSVDISESRAMINILGFYKHFQQKEVLMNSKKLVKDVFESYNFKSEEEVFDVE